MSIKHDLSPQAFTTLEEEKASKVVLKIFRT